MKGLLFGILLGLLGWAAGPGACLADSAAPSPEPIRIGMLLPLGSDPATGSSALQNGVLLGIRLVNEAGGAPLGIVHRDSGSTVPSALAAARKLVTGDGVKAVIGPLTSDEAIELAGEIAVPSRIPFVSPGAAAPDLSEVQDDGFLFRTFPSDLFQARALAEVARERGWRRLGVLFVNNLDGRGLARSFRKAVEGTGGEITSFLPLLAAQTSYRAELARALELGGDAILVSAAPAEGTLLLRQMAEGKAAPALLLPGRLRPYPLTAGIPALPEGTWGCAFAPPDTRLAQRFREAYGEVSVDPGFFPDLAVGFDTSVLLALAVARAAALGGPVDGPAIRDSLPAVANPPGEKVDFSSLARALALLAAGEEIDYEGVSGPVDFDANGDLTQGSYAVWTVEGALPRTLRIQNW